MVSTRSEALSPGISWNATRAASVLLVMIIAAIALLFWPSFESARPMAPRAAGVDRGRGPTRTDRGRRQGLRAVPAVT